MFANCSAGGMNQAAGDICLTPQPAPAPPVPAPYVNISQNAAAVSTVPTLILAGGPAHNLATVVPMSSGDEAGSVGGVVSGTVVGATKFNTGSTKVLYGGKPATRLTSMTSQNNNNCVGSTIAPSQTKVLILAG